MTFNLASFGTGVGLVIVGWVVGLGVGYLFSLSAIMSTIGGNRRR